MSAARLPNPLSVTSPARVLTKALPRAAEILGLRGVELARIVGTSPASISRLSKDRVIDPESKEGELALLFLRLHRSLHALVGGQDERAREWLRAENSALGGCPIDLIGTTIGLVHVVEYLDAMRGR